VYECADPTDMDDKEFAIPKLDTAHIGRVLDQLHEQGGGRYWCTHLDRKSQDNPVLFLEIGRRVVAFPALVRGGEDSYSWEQKERKHTDERARWQADSLVNEKKFAATRADFLTQCQSYLDTAVYVSGSPEHLGSDITGTLNAAFRSLSVEDGNGQPIRKLVVFFSDMEHRYAAGEPLMERPADIPVVAVNPRPGATKKVLEDVTEVDHPDRVFNLLDQLVREAGQATDTTTAQQTAHR
jgi:hypothetical protein